MWGGVLTWLDASPSRFAAAAWSVFAVTVAIALTAALSREVRRWWQNPLVFAAFALLSIAAFRWPLLLDNQELTDPDESQMISGALTLNHDSEYWRAVDGQTRGPLDDWPLLAVLRMTGHLDYTDARLVSVFLAWLGVICAWLTLRHVLAGSWAAVLVLPLLALHAFSDSWRFVQYGSEHVSNALIALSSALLLTAWRFPDRAPACGRLYLAGLALGSVAFAKPQAAPIAAWVALFAIWLIFDVLEVGHRSRCLSALIGGALTAPVVGLVWIAAHGIWGDFYVSYILDNVRYAGARWFSWAETPSMFYVLAGAEPGVRPFLAGAAAATFIAILGYPFFSRFQRRVVCFALGLAGVSACAAMAPGRLFTHYLQLVFFPAGLLAGAVVGCAIEAANSMLASRHVVRRLSKAAIVGLFLALGLAPQIAWRYSESQPSTGRFSETHGALQRTAVARMILEHAHAGESLGIWGWGPKFWVQTALLQATRDGNCSRQIDEGPSRERYRMRYMSDLARSKPPVFIDVVGDGNFAFHDREAFGQGTFYDLNIYIRSNYQQIADTEGTRVYVRRDRE